MQPRRGHMLEQTSQKLHGLEVLDDGLVIVRILRMIENLSRTRLEREPLDCHGRAQQVPAEPLDPGRVSRRHAHHVVDAESAMTPGEQELDPLLAQQSLVAQQSDHPMLEEALGLACAHERHRHPLSLAGPSAARSDSV